VEMTKMIECSEEESNLYPPSQQMLECFPNYFTMVLMTKINFPDMHLSNNGWAITTVKIPNGATFIHNLNGDGRNLVRFFFKTEEDAVMARMKIG
jgi:hypothetical protein